MKEDEGGSVIRVIVKERKKKMDSKDEGDRWRFVKERKKVKVKDGSCC